MNKLYYASKFKYFFAALNLLQKLDKAEKLSTLAEEDISSVIREAPGKLHTRSRRSKK